MSAQHHVFGSAGVYVGAGQSAGTVALFGLSDDGVNIEIVHYVDPIHDDRGGPNIATDEQRMGAEARITAGMIWYDETIRAAVFAEADNGTTEGTLGYSGPLFGLGSIYYPLVIQPVNGSSSPTSESLWNFPTARMLDAQQVKFGTVRNVWRITWKAVAYPGTATNVNGAVLYKHAFP